MTGSSPEAIKHFEEGMKALSGEDINSVIMDLQLAVNQSIADRRMVIEVFYKRRYVDSHSGSNPKPQAADLTKYNLYSFV